MENIINDLPVFYINFDEEEFESGIDKIALTEDPAIEVMSMRFNKNEKRKLKLSKDKNLIIGPAIIPDKPIYRRDGDFEYYVVFTKDVVEKMVEKFNSEQREIKFNLEHNNEKEIKGFIKESWIIEDDKFDKSKLYGFENLPIGTWMISAKITDNDVWNYVVKNMDQVGFSIEGLMGIQLEEFNKQKNISISPNIDIDELIDIKLDEYKNKNKNKTMKKVKKNKYFSNQVVLKRKFNKGKKRFEEEIVISDELDVLIAEDLVEGTEIEIITDEGVIAPAEDGTYIIPDEEIQIEVEEGVIINVEEVETIDEEFEEDKEKEEEELESDEDKEKVEEELEAEEGEVVVEESDDELIEKIAELESRLEDVEKEVEEVIEDNDLEFNKKKKKNFSTIQSLIYFNKSNFRNK